MNKNNNYKVYPTDIIIIKRTRGWRSKLAAAIKNYPPAPLEDGTHKAVIEIVYTLSAITVTKTWR